MVREELAAQMTNPERQGSGKEAVLPEPTKCSPPAMTATNVMMNQSARMVVFIF